MKKFKAHTLLVFLALFTITAHKTMQEPPNNNKHNSHNTMANNGVPIRQHNRGRDNPTRAGGHGGRGGCPASSGRGLQPNKNRVHSICSVLEVGVYRV